MSRAMKARPRSTSSRRSTATSPPQIRTSYDALAVYVNKDNPLEKLTLAQVGRHLLEDPPPRRQERQHLGRPRPHRRLGGPPDLALRPQLRVRHVRLLQGARAEERRLQGLRQGAAGLGLGRPGRDRGPLRHRLQRHRLQDVGRQGACSSPRQDQFFDGAYDERARAASTRSRASSTSTSTRRRASPSIPLVKEYVKLILSKDGQEVVVKDGYLPALRRRSSRKS